MKNYRISTENYTTQMKTYTTQMLIICFVLEFLFRAYLSEYKELSFPLNLPY